MPRDVDFVGSKRNKMANIRLAGFLSSNFYKIYKDLHNVNE